MRKRGVLLKSARIYQNKKQKAAAGAVVLLPRRQLRPAGALRTGRHEEVKICDVNYAQYGLTTTGVFQALNLIQTGTSFNNRQGRKICMRSLYVTGALEFLARANATAQEYIRLIVIYDRQTNGGTPSVADYILSTSQAGVASSTVFDQFNPNNRDRFVTLMDMRITPPMPQQNLSAAPPNVALTTGTSETINIKRFIPLKGLVTQYKADSSPAVIGDIATGSLLFFAFGSTAAGSEQWQANLSFRLRYTDA